MIRSWLPLFRGRSTEVPRPRLRLETLEDRIQLSATQVPTLDLSGIQVDTSRYDSSHLLVRFRDASHPSVLPGTHLGSAVDLVPGLFVVELDPGASLTEAVEAYRSSPNVITAELDYHIGTSWVPNDPRLGDQWDMRNTGQQGGTVGADINAPSAWGITGGSRRNTVAVIDTGIDYTHQDLYLNIWINQKEIPASRRANLIDTDGDYTITFWDLRDPRNQGAGKITDLNGNGYIDGGDLLRPMIKDANGKDTGQGGWVDGVSQDGDRYVDDIIGWNSNANNNNPMDGYGHGTHVAGTIGAIGNNGIGVAGVNWQISMAGVKFFDDSGNGTILQAIAGLDWVLAKGIRISNNSWTDSAYSSTLYEAVRRARDKGHLFVAAAGNNGRNTDVSPAYPSGYNLDNVVAVGATDRYNQLASYSNYGEKSVDILAPGSNITSTNPGNNYGSRSGTSMSTPHVTGVLALAWSGRPEWSYGQVISWVMQTAKRVPSLAGKSASGLLDVGAAVRLPPRTASVPSVASTTTTTSSTTSTGTRLASLSSVSANDLTPDSARSEDHPVQVASSNPALLDSTNVTDEAMRSLNWLRRKRPESSPIEEWLRLEQHG